jgi:P27 family predicted phage terminase small subunit
MKRGQKPTPKALRILRGNPSKKRLPRNEPDGVGDLWSPPSYFDSEQRDEWDRVIENAPRSLLTGTDRDIVAAYVVAVVEYARAVIEVRTGGQIEKTKNGNVIQNPYLGILNRQALLIYKFGSQLGFSPAARASLGNSIYSSSMSSDRDATTIAQFLAERPN